ncbi:MAG TPA: HAMP domain-containing protein, partial [Candidatus Bathyarchaeia archaeon]|nr:HAMP domain-containing protein [Candidatus Bathyarchaeia archaeon]
MPKKRKPFQLYVTTALILAAVFPLLLNNLLIYKFTYDASFQNLRKRLMLIAQISAELIDVQTLQAIPLNREGIQSEHFKTTAAKLAKIKQISPLVRYIYVMQPTDETGTWKFIVDPDPTERRGKTTLTAYPGDPYEASRFPEMMRALNEPSADTKLERDEWGMTLSGYAPLYDSNHQVAAVLGVDMKADDVYALQNAIKQRTLVVLALGIFLSILLGIFLSKQITRPIDLLVEGTRHLARGNLDHKVPVRRHDEIGELAVSFNKMAHKLKQSRHHLINYFYGIVRTLVRIIEVKDHYTRGHSQHVARLVVKIARKLGHPPETIKLFRRLTLLHDIGKLGI